ncbi:unnamed protein product [Prorocentrum cordatum]|uniref:Uncharacterized protein n=1 Tax=Prorocentrum cordatum TaxID=2364126 RepID=A0ABN9T317_9DINO|nr:unnamed protein product [Polarella glacialis]
MDLMLPERRNESACQGKEDEEVDGGVEAKWRSMASKTRGTGRDGYAGEGREQSSPSLILSFFGLLLGARHPGAAPVQMLVRQARPAREHQPRAPSAPGGPRAGLEPYTGRAGGGDGGREQDHGRGATPEKRKQLRSNASPAYSSRHSPREGAPADMALRMPHACASAASWRAARL